MTLTVEQSEFGCSESRCNLHEFLVYSIFLRSSQVPLQASSHTLLFSRRELPFTKTAHLSNPWNEHKPVKIGRDGQVSFICHFKPFKIFFLFVVQLFLLFKTIFRRSNQTLVRNSAPSSPWMKTWTSIRWLVVFVTSVVLRQNHGLVVDLHSANREG